MKNLKIKKVRLPYDEWQAILAKDYRQQTLETADFSGKTAVITIRQVTEPQFWQQAAQQITVCDVGMTWFIFVPDNAGYAVTMMLDQIGEPVVWYIDLIGGCYTDYDGIFYVEDLFLDLIVYPDGRLLEDDRDELLAAHQQELITTTQLKRVEAVAAQLKEQIQNDFPAFRRAALDLYQQSCV